MFAADCKLEDCSLAISKFSTPPAKFCLGATGDTMAGHLASLDADHALYTFAVYYKFENGLLAIGKIYTADSPALSSISAYHHNRIFSPWMNFFL